MPGPDENGKSLDGTKEQKFLFAEYQALIDIDRSRNERLDRFLTIFMTLAAAPWALYALTLKESSGASSLSTIPFPVAAAFVLIGVLGALVTMMYIQMRFTIILYTRALNAIRGYFLDPNTRLSFRLPTNPEKPDYYEAGSYIYFGIAGMAVVNSGYIGLGLFNLICWPESVSVRIWVFVVLSAACWIGHLVYYSSQASRRESHSKGPSLRWKE
jgi:hypothetical protein